MNEVRELKVEVYETTQDGMEQLRATYNFNPFDEYDGFDVVDENKTPFGYSCEFWLAKTYPYWYKQDGVYTIKTYCTLNGVAFESQTEPDLLQIKKRDGGCCEISTLSYIEYIIDDLMNEDLYEMIQMELKPNNEPNNPPIEFDDGLPF